MKKRKPEKLNAVIGCTEMHTALHDLKDERRAIVNAITQEWDLPPGTAATVHMKHPALANLPSDTLRQTTHNGTLAMLLNAGRLMEHIARLAFADNRMAIGSSANVSLRGVKFQATEIEPEILEAADIVIDYGLMRWNRYNRSSTMINVSTMTVIRYGSCFDLIDNLLRTHFNIAYLQAPTRKTDVRALVYDEMCDLSGMRITEVAKPAKGRMMSSSKCMRQALINRLESP